MKTIIRYAYVGVTKSGNVSPRDMMTMSDGTKFPHVYIEPSSCFGKPQKVLVTIKAIADSK